MNRTNLVTAEVTIEATATTTLDPIEKRLQEHLKEVDRRSFQYEIDKKKRNNSYTVFKTLLNETFRLETKYGNYKSVRYSKQDLINDFAEILGKKLDIETINSYIEKFNGDENNICIYSNKDPHFGDRRESYTMWRRCN